jgi:hypothetical protein
VSAVPPKPGAVLSRLLKENHFVLDDDDRITYVRPGSPGGLSPFIGRLLWERLPGAEPLLRDKLDEARRTGRVIEFAVFYAGRTQAVRAVPAADGLALHVEQLTELDVRTLATLAESLLKIEAELAAREPGQLDPPAPSSPLALP